MSGPFDTADYTPGYRARIAQLEAEVRGLHEELALRDDSLANRRVRELEAALCELHRAVKEHDGSDADDARLGDALAKARELAPYVRRVPGPSGGVF